MTSRPRLAEILADHQCGYTYIVAEIGSNYRMGTAVRDMAMCRTMISLAAEAGVDAVKFQCFHASRYYAYSKQKLSYLGEDVRLDAVVDDLSLSPDMVVDLAHISKDHGVDFLCSAFSPEDLRVVDAHVPAHKIASSEINHLRLLEAAAASGRPVLLSTGASDLEEIDWALSVLRENGAKTVCLLQCAAAYPAPAESVNLNAMAELGVRFNCRIGFSDHTEDPVAAPLAAVALGAAVVEKHVTLDKRLPGPDHAMSVTFKELADLVRKIRLVEQMLGTAQKKIVPAEKFVREFAKRALHTIKKVSAGEVLIENVNYAILRPGFRKPGLRPRDISLVEGRRAVRNLEAGEGIREDDLF